MPIAALTAVRCEALDTLPGRASATDHTPMFAPSALGLGVGAALVEPVGHGPC